MAYMTDPTRHDATMPMMEEPSPAQASAPMMMQFRIKRVGARPLVFRGMELGMAMSFTPAMPYWYEVNVFRTVEHTFVLAIKMFFQSAEEKDTVNAWTCETLTEALDKLEAYDPADDIRVAVSVADPKLSAPELAAHAMDLRARALSARRHFSGLVGEFLYDLDNVA